MYIAILFITAENQKQPRCFSTAQCITNSRTSIQQNATQQQKANKPLTHTIAWMNLTCILLRERSQTSKSYLLRDSFHMTFWKMQNDGTKKRSVVVRVYGVVEQFPIKNWHRGILGVKELLWMDLWGWTYHSMYLSKTTELQTAT